MTHEETLEILAAGVELEFYAEEEREKEFNHTAWLTEKYENEKQYSKRMEASSLLAHKQIGILQAMLFVASFRLSDEEKEEIKKNLAKLDKEREDFSENYENNTLKLLP
ncbi:MAG: hypothetical protein ACOVNU_11700 [Candidatus Kapaibacteriota bacterium]